MNDTLTIATRSCVRWLVLNRPEVLNAINGVMVDGLVDALNRACDEPGVCAIVLAGEGRAFSAGGDLKAGEALRASLGPTAPVDHFLLPFQQLLTRIRAASKPVIAAVHGHCLAGGLELVLACDLVVAATDAQFGDPRGARGMLPALGGPWSLLRSLGTFRAKELLLTGANWNAERMQQGGLVSVVCEPADLRDEAQRLAAGFAERSPESTALIKRMLNEEAEMGWQEALAHELSLNREHLGGGDAVSRGLAAFRDRAR